jgi:hypothetical protein
MATRKLPKPALTKARGESTIRGLKDAIAWTEGRNDQARVTLVDVPEIAVRKVRLKRRLSQLQWR